MSNISAISENHLGKMTAAKKEEKVEDVEMKDAEEEKAGENCILTIVPKFLCLFQHNH